MEICLAEECSLLGARPGLVETLFPVGLEGSVSFPSTSGTKWLHDWGRTSMGTKPLWPQYSGMALHS